MLSRRPLQALANHGTPKGEESVKDTKKPLRNLPSNNLPNLSAKKPRVPRAKLEQIQTRLGTHVQKKPSSKVLGSDHAASRIPFTIFEDLSPCAKPQLKVEKMFPVPVYVPNVKYSGEEQRKWMTAKDGEEPESYWIEIAEERRLALLETVKENQQLQQMVQMLTQQNKTLMGIAQEKEHFEQLVVGLATESEDLSTQTEESCDVTVVEEKE